MCENVLSKWLKIVKVPKFALSAKLLNDKCAKEKKRKKRSKKGLEWKSKSTQTKVEYKVKHKCV